MGIIATEVNVQVEGFPSSSPVLTIGHLSDFHLSLFVSERQVRRAVEIANQQQPDLIALTGDYITAGERYIRRLGRLLAPLSAPLGVYAVLGNHDHLANGNKVSAALAEVGIEVLQNQSRILEREPRPSSPAKRSSRFAVVGVDDPQRGDCNLSDAMKEVPDGLPAVILSHNPDILYAVQKRPATLVLAGHSHGGQFFRLGRYILEGTKFGKKHPYGLHRLDKAQIYITSGVGTTFLPIRFCCPAEVAVIQISGAGRTKG